MIGKREGREEGGGGRELCCVKKKTGLRLSRCVRFIKLLNVRYFCGLSIYFFCYFDRAEHEE